MSNISIKRLCSRCLGTGTDDSTQETCLPCEGSGWVAVNQINISEITTKLDDIMNKCNDIAEAIEGLE